eukprot:142804-Chlamydomonas_euryale.AAC.3
MRRRSPERDIECPFRMRAGHRIVLHEQHSTESLPPGCGSGRDRIGRESNYAPSGAICHRTDRRGRRRGAGRGVTSRAQALPSRHGGPGRLARRARPPPARAAPAAGRR